MGELKHRLVRPFQNRVANPVAEVADRARLRAGELRAAGDDRPQKRPRAPDPGRQRPRSASSSGSSPSTAPERPTCATSAPTRGSACGYARAAARSGAPAPRPSCPTTTRASASAGWPPPAPAAAATCPRRARLRQLPADRPRRPRPALRRHLVGPPSSAGTARACGRAGASRRRRRRCGCRSGIAGLSSGRCRMRMLRSTGTYVSASTSHVVRARRRRGATVPVCAAALAEQPQQRAARSGSPRRCGAASPSRTIASTIARGSAAPSSSARAPSVRRGC